jgi:hypothetical protein
MQADAERIWIIQEIQRRAKIGIFTTSGIAPNAIAAANSPAMAAMGSRVGSTPASPEHEFRLLQ